MSGPTENGQGLLHSLKKLLESTVALAHQRLELFAVELQEERCRWLEAALLAGAVVLLGGMALMVLSAAIILLFWENGRLLAAGCLFVVYVTGAVLCWRALLRRLKDRTAFSATVGEFKKDQEWLERRN